MIYLERCVMHVKKLAYLNKILPTNYIYDGVDSINEDYAVIGPYYDFKVIMVNDSRDIYVRYDFRSDKYYCGFNGF